MKDGKTETPDEIKRWFLKEVEKLWPVASGSISYRKSPCIREHCPVCEHEGGHGAHVLQGKLRGKRFGLYVPEDLAETVAAAIGRGRELQELMMEAGDRYAKALKEQRKQEQARAKGKD